MFRLFLDTFAEDTVEKRRSIDIAREKTVKLLKIKFGNKINQEMISKIDTLSLRKVRYITDNFFEIEFDELLKILK